MTAYEVVTLTDAESERLVRVHDDLMELARCEVPSVRAAARAALAQIAEALNGQGLAYELYAKELAE